MKRASVPWLIHRLARAVANGEAGLLSGIPGRQDGECREEARRRVAAVLFAEWRAQRRRQATR